MVNDFLLLTEIPPEGEENTGYSGDLQIGRTLSGDFCFHCTDRAAHSEVLNQSVVYLTREDMLRLISWLQERV